MGKNIIHFVKLILRISKKSGTASDSKFRATLSQKRSKIKIILFFSAKDPRLTQAKISSCGKKAQHSTTLKSTYYGVKQLFF